MLRPSRVLLLTLALLLAALAALAAAPAAAQTVRGRVLDARTGAPVPEATVTALVHGRRAARERSSASGAFDMKLPNVGTYRLRVERIGYQAWESGDIPVLLDETVEVDLRISDQPLAVEPLTVTARQQPRRVPSLDARGFYARQRFGYGRFVTREQWKNRFNRGLSTILMREPGVMHVVDARGRVTVFFARSFGSSAPAPPEAAAGRRSRSRPGPSTAPCPPTYYLDGMKVQVGGAVTIDDLIAPEQVEAMELFRGPSEVPAQYNDSEAGCGVVLIWSRQGDGTP